MAKKVPTKKILLFMSTSTRALIDPARAATVALIGAVEQQFRAGRLKNRKVAAHILIYGYQLETGAELGSSTITATAAGAQSASPTTYGDARRDYIPGDYSRLATWLDEGTHIADDETLDSTLLIVWGHGAGVAIDPAFIRALQPANGAPRFDIVVLDSCLMASVEVAYAFRRAATHLIASQTFTHLEPGAPGVNTGELAHAFLDDDAWGQPSRDDNDDRGRRIERAAQDMVDLVGDANSGARQLVLVTPGRFGERGDAAALRAPIGDVAPSHGLLTLLQLFATLLRESAMSPDEQVRVLDAFRRTAFLGVRQFLDLQDLARQIHLRSRSKDLQLVALALIDVLRPSRQGVVGRHRLAIADGLDRRSLGGLTIYCPWFRDGVDAAGVPALNVVADVRVYRELEFVQHTQWSVVALDSPLAQIAQDAPTADGLPSMGFPYRAPAASVPWAGAATTECACPCRFEPLVACPSLRASASSGRTRDLYGNKPSGPTTGPAGDIVVFGSPVFDDALQRPASPYL